MLYTPPLNFRIIIITPINFYWSQFSAWTSHLSQIIKSVGLQLIN